MKKLCLYLSISLFLLPVSASGEGLRTATENETQVGTTCKNAQHGTDFDTLTQCTSTGTTDGTKQKAPLFIGEVTAPPYADTTCDSDKAGMIQYTSSEIQYCNGSAWTTFSEKKRVQDDYTVLLLHMDQYEPHRFSDFSSQSRLHIDMDLMPEISNLAKFGSGSGYFNGGKVVGFRDSVDWAYTTLDFTIEGWVYPTNNTGNYKGIVTQGVDGVSQRVFLYTNDSGQVVFSSFISGGTLMTLTSSTSLPLNSWTHVAIVRHGTSFNLYINGISEATATSSASMPNVNGSLMIGARNDDYFSGFMGYLDEVRISKGIARWTSNFTVPSAPY